MQNLAQKGPLLIATFIQINIFAGTFRLSESKDQTEFEALPSERND